MGFMTQNSSKSTALVIAILASFLTPFMVSAINVALPSIGDEFNANAISLGWVATAYLLAAAVFLVPFGRIADIYGRKKVFFYGIIVYTTAAALAAFSPSLSLLILFRSLEGLGAAMIFGTAMAILVAVYPKEQRGRVLGINVAAVYIGLSIGPFLGGLLTQQFGWRSIFLWNIPIGILIIALIILRLKGEWTEAEGESLDTLGSIIYGISLLTGIYGLSRLPAPIGILLIVIGLSGFVMFVIWELRCTSPVVDINLFSHNRVFAFSNLAALINYSATFAVTFLLSLFLQYVKGLSPQEAGIILIAQPITMAIFSPIAGRISDRIEPRLVATTGMTVTFLGLLLFSIIEETTSLHYMIFGLIVLGFGFALFSSPNTNAIMSSVEKRYYGIASGMFGTMRLLGQMFSLAIATTVFAVVIGPVEITPLYHPEFIISVKTGFLIFAALCFAGIFASIVRGKVHS